MTEQYYTFGDWRAKWEPRLLELVGHDLTDEIVSDAVQVIKNLVHGLVSDLSKEEDE